jgi:DMSO reductase family type II enzyme heme b subunit
VRHSKLIKALIVAFTLGFFAVANAADIKAVKVNGAIPTDPDNPFWSERYGPTALKHVIIDMDPQMITNPMWPNPETKYVFVKAATNGKEIAVHLEYNDPSRNDMMVKAQQYKDQVAIMFPVNQSGEEPPFTMGGDGERVNIWQWKATWDREGAGKNGNSAMGDMEDEYDTWLWELVLTTCTSLMASCLVKILPISLVQKLAPIKTVERETSASVLPISTSVWVRTKVSLILVDL